MGRDRKPILETEIARLNYDASQMSYILGLSDPRVGACTLSVKRSISPTGKRGRPGFVYLSTIRKASVPLAGICTAHDFAHMAMTESGAEYCEIPCTGKETVGFVWGLAIQEMGE